MTYLSLSRAARLAGVTRAELQRRIRRGEIATFEGAVAVEDLLRAYPAVSLTNDAALERVERIKRDALPKLNAGETVLPSPEVFLSRLRGLSETLAERIAANELAHTLLDQVGARLAGLAAQPPEQLSAALREIQDWFVDARRQLALHPVPDGRAQLLAKDTFLRIMAANVKLIPSGHDFFVEGNESILDASVRAGLKLSYGCSSGNCGDCKVRLISGETRKIRDHDYVISEREKSMGYLLSCSQTAVTDLVIEAAEALSVDDLPQQEIRASLRKLERLSPDLIALNIQTPRTHTLRFMAGQRARLTLEDGATRELSIASCPCNGRNLWFYVRRQDDAFSERVFNSLHPGHLVTVTGPQGDFVLVEDAPEPAILIAFGDGIAPIKSLIEHAVSIDLIESFHLYWDTTYPDGHHQAHWGRALKDALDNFSFTPLMSGRPEDVIAVVRADHSGPDRPRYYLAGPAELVQRAAVLLRDQGIEKARIKLEHTDT
ncbi:2Fe-2S iron-sulfur cluster-binding protein [Thiocystis violascens]|uniref:Flavodoxin reductase family protein n=1 Tax=Thiocystis violascens (strain ATCC 17096 / DSM 198 / 6111) TaxID=765911 RepID=I3Y736_THIV6|nr:2Fe-2S iron-sulfur cluster-binding protein [Thiocystis violascens]AFL72804.1 flavodoxin reductase family protein [Thiocystis violascens DSM 198]